MGKALQNQVKELIERKDLDKASFNTQVSLLEREKDSIKERLMFYESIQQGKDDNTDLFENRIRSLEERILEEQNETASLRKNINDKDTKISVMEDLMKDMYGTQED